MSGAASIPVSEYLNSSYRPDCDYLDGELLERNVGEWDHSRLQMLLSRFLFDREKQWGIVVVPEQRVQVGPTRFRVPDITVIAGSPDGRSSGNRRFFALKFSRLATVWLKCRNGLTII